jgi:peptide chain release factor 1
VFALFRQKVAAKEVEQRRSLLGSGDRSERIRTYNYPENRVTDHRIGLTLTGVADVMAGGAKLHTVVEQLQLRHQMDALERMLRLPGA